jgi:hypothetical protein
VTSISDDEKEENKIQYKNDTSIVNNWLTRSIWRQVIIVTVWHIESENERTCIQVMRSTDKNSKALANVYSQQ